MASEHIARLHKIGMGKETTSGTAVSAAVWIPKSGGKLIPNFDVKMDEMAYGVIDGNRQGQTTKEMSAITINGEPQGKWFGHMLMATFGSAYACVRHPISSPSGTFVE